MRFLKVLAAKEEGYSMVELLIVMLILGTVLAGLLNPAFWLLYVVWLIAATNGFHSGHGLRRALDLRFKQIMDTGRLHESNLDNR